MWYSLSVVVILVITGSFFYYSLQHKLNKEVNHLLLDKSEDILQQFLVSNPNLDDLKKEIELETSSGKFNKVSARLFDADQNLILISRNFVYPPLLISSKSITSARNGKVTIETIQLEGMESPFQVLTRPVFDGNLLKYILQLAIYLEPAYKTSENFKENIMMLIPGVIVISIIGGWFISRKSLTPVGEIIKSARSITGSNLSLRLRPIHTGDELEEMTDTINLMLHRLEESFKKIIRFTSDISHELRTPIATLKAGTEVILTKKRTTEEYCELLENNLGEFEKITRMINDLLVLLRSDSGKESLQIKSFSLGKMLKGLATTFAIIAEAKDINFSMDEIEEIKISGDESLLSRALSNILDNTIKYTLPGGHVNIAMEDMGDMVLIRIKDTGIGIAEEDKDRIFDRFFRSEPSRSRETGGIGLGLSISKNIIELHNGKIEVKSTLGIGSAFIVTLPKNYPPHIIKIC